MTELPNGWVLEPLIKHITSKSGDSKIIKGKQSSKPQPGLFQGFSASGADVWVPEAHYQGKGIVVSAVGARCGKTFQAEGEWTAIANTHVLVPSRECGVDFKWLWYLTNDEDFWVRSGTAQPFVKVKDTLLRPQLIPPLEEQKRIVEALDDHLSRLDKALAEIQAADLGLTNLRHASLDSLLIGDPEPFPIVTLGTLGKWVTGSTPKTSNPLYQGEDVPFVTPGDILYGGEILSVRRRISNQGADTVRRLPPPSVQVVCIGATLGKVGYSSEEVTTNQQITSLLPYEDVVTAGYAAWLLSSPLVQSLLWQFSSSTTVPILNKGALEQIEVPLAPLEKQSEILAQIDSQSELSSSLTERTILARKNVDSLRRSILHRAFSGELLEAKV